MFLAGNDSLKVEILKVEGVVHCRPTSAQRSDLHITSVRKDHSAESLLDAYPSDMPGDGDLEITVESPELTTSPTSPTNTVTRSSRVRFHSRVRITSGLNRHRISAYSQYRHDCSNYDHDHDQCSFSRDSSLSGSPSSSISAPLHSRADEETGKPGWGPLGQRVNLFSQNSRRKRARVRQESLLNGGLADERLPLMRGSRLKPSYVNGEIPDLSSDEEERLSNEVDNVFGRFPRRLLNPHVSCRRRFVGIPH